MPRDADSLRRFFLAEPPAGGVARLLEEDERHALQVLRVAEGDEVVGLDGRGGAWRLEATAVAKRRLELGVREELPREPAPGERGAALPWIELWLPLPKGGRAEEMVDRLTQLGAARIAALDTLRTAPHAREAGAKRIERLARRAREACKQSGRRWLPELDGPASIDERASRIPAGARLAILDPRAERTLSALLTEPPADGANDTPLVLALGPEGGWDPTEARALEAHGAARVRLAPHVLRIETAAEAACAIAAHAALGR